jgi:hypothetical protein
MSIHVHIGRLAIDSDLLGGSSPRKVQLAIEQALRVQLAHPDAAVALGNLGHVDAMPSQAVPGGSLSLGMRVGTALAQSLGMSVAKGASRG